MLDDFDEITLKDLTSNEPIGPIAVMRKAKQTQDNTFIISRENFDKSSNEQIEAWFTKFDQVIIDDSKNPYVQPLSKKELAKKIGVTLYSKLTRENMQKGIGIIQKGTGMIGEFGKAFGGTSTRLTNQSRTRSKSNTGFLTSQPKRNSLKIWSDEKKQQVKPRRRKRKAVKKEPSNFLTGNKKITFSSSKKVRFF